MNRKHVLFFDKKIQFISYKNPLYAHVFKEKKRANNTPELFRFFNLRRV